MFLKVKVQFSGKIGVESDYAKGGIKVISVILQSWRNEQHTQGLQVQEVDKGGYRHVHVGKIQLYCKYVTWGIKNGQHVITIQTPCLPFRIVFVVVVLLASQPVELFIVSCDLFF